MANKEHEASVPLLNNTELDLDHDYDHGSIGSDSVTLSGPTIYTPSVSEPASDDGLPEYHDVIPPHCDSASAVVKDLKADTAQIEEDAGLDNNSDNDKRGRRRCCGRSRRATTGKKQQVRRRVFMFLKIAFLLGIITFLIARRCVRSKRADDAMWMDCPQIDYYDSASREIRLERGSRAIWGRYPLYDLLSLSTTSGSIAINVDPQPAHPDHPDKPARLILETQSGSVAVRFSHPLLNPIFEHDAKDLDSENKPFILDYEDIKPHRNSCVKHLRKHHRHQKADKTTAAAAIQYRPYEVEIRTQTGSISAKLIFSSSAHIESSSGAISASLIPVVSADEATNATLVTRTSTAAQSIVLAEPYVIGSDDNNAVVASAGYASSSHTSDSGHINVRYPHSWAGTVDAYSHGGPICLNGEGLEVSKDGQGFASGVKYPADNVREPEWWGSRGDMEVYLEAQGSGSINFFLKNHPHLV